jgi:hypothetical protein
LERSGNTSEKYFFKGLKNYENYFSIQEKEMIMGLLKKKLNTEIYDIITS